MSIMKKVLPGHGALFVGILGFCFAFWGIGASFLNAAAVFGVLSLLSHVCVEL